MNAKEHRDLYIAAAVGGVGLVLVLLFLFSPSAAVAAAAPATDLADQAPAGQSDYNYNIAPYNPAPLITNGRATLPSAGGGGCCDTCGPDTGSQYNLPNTSQFLTLLGTGAG